MGTLPQDGIPISDDLNKGQPDASKTVPPKLTLRTSEVSHEPHIATNTLGTKDEYNDTKSKGCAVQCVEIEPETPKGEKKHILIEQNQELAMSKKDKLGHVATSPSELAPEVLLSPSDYSPELSQDMIFGKEIIRTVDEKMIHVQGLDDKVLHAGGRTNSFDEKIVREESDYLVGRKIPWYAQKRYRLLVVGAFIILLCLAGSTAWLGVRSRRNANRISTKEIPATTGLAATQWSDREGVKHYRVYFQDEKNAILESAWDSNSTGWTVSTVAGAEMGVRRNTPIGVMNGWPHANYTFTHIKQIYYIGSNEAIFERATNSSPSNSWYNDNFSGKFRASPLSSLTTYWAQNVTNSSQEALALFQEHDGSDIFSIARYYDYRDRTQNWGTTKYNFSTLRGSPLAMVPRTDPRVAYDISLYIANPKGQLAQYRYNISTGIAEDKGVVISESVISPGLPLTVVAQNDTAFFETRGYYPECARPEPLMTHLILYANPDRSGLVLHSLNCSHGLINQTAKIAKLNGRSRRYLGLASHNDGKVYVEYDQGSGREMEEWTVPPTSLHEWALSSQVKTKLEIGGL